MRAQGGFSPAPAVPAAPAWPAAPPTPASVAQQVKAIEDAMPHYGCSAVVLQRQGPCLKYNFVVDEFSAFGSVVFGDEIQDAQGTEAAEPSPNPLDTAHGPSQCDVGFVFMIDLAYVDPASIKTGSAPLNRIDTARMRTGGEPPGPWVQLVSMASGAIAEVPHVTDTQPPACAMPRGDLKTLYLPFATTQGRDDAAKALRGLIVQAQLANDTFQWIRTTLTAYGYKPTETDNSIVYGSLDYINAHYVIDDSQIGYRTSVLAPPVVDLTLKYADITSVTYEDNATFGIGRVVLTGNVQSLLSLPAGSAAPKSIELTLGDHGDGGRKLAEAFTYIAKISGAKISDAKIRVADSAAAR